MAEKREQARRTAAAEAGAVAEQQARDVLAGLRHLGVRADDARRAAQFCATLADATLEERMRAALRLIGPKPRRIGTSVGPST